MPDTVARRSVPLITHREIPVKHFPYFPILFLLSFFFILTRYPPRNRVPVIQGGQGMRREALPSIIYYTNGVLFLRTYIRVLF